MNRELRKHWPSEGHFESRPKNNLSLKGFYLTTSHIPEEINPNPSILKIRQPQNATKSYIFLNFYLYSVT